MRGTNPQGSYSHTRPPRMDPSEIARTLRVRVFTAQRGVVQSILRPPVAVVRIEDTAKRLAAMRGANPQGTYNRTRPPRMDLNAAPLSTRHSLTVY